MALANLLPAEFTQILLRVDVGVSLRGNYADFRFDADRSIGNQIGEARY